MNGPGVRDRKRVHAINVGVGRDVTIAELASLVAGVVGFKRQIEFDTSRPEAPRCRRWTRRP
jgi:nucleoside-diphosphate-sugar epimerase